MKIAKLFPASATTTAKGTAGLQKKLSKKLKIGPQLLVLGAYGSSYFTYNFTMLLPTVGEVWALNSH